MSYLQATKDKLQGVGMACIIGKCTNANSGTGGVIQTGLSRVVSVQLTPANSTTTLPYVSSISGGAVTFVCGNTDSVYYAIFGV